MAAESCVEYLSSGESDNFVMGLFEGSTLAGMAGFRREPGEKRRHRGRIWGLYVAPEHRRKGFGRALLVALMDAARRTVRDLDSICLSITNPQEAAEHLYVELGFRSLGIEPRALRVGDRYIDEEWCAAVGGIVLRRRNRMTLWAMPWTLITM
jgi:ribosomal protein S18 acetylase RimI-like enzyme